MKSSKGELGEGQPAIVAERIDAIEAQPAALPRADRYSALNNKEEKAWPS
jgi:hypothetical protein